MKIEKVNENQIRCTLTREDLASRELKISELAYGTEKAKTLFRDMMRQANFEFGFEAEDIPLMIEAIPLNAECIVLVITKVEDPEELDTRFARFAPSVTEETENDEEFTDNNPEEIMDLFHKLQTAEPESSEEKAESTPTKTPEILTRIFLFDELSQIMNASRLVADHFLGASTLYKDNRSGQFLLLLTEDSGNRDNFDRTCNTLSEYGSLLRKFPTGDSFLEEHCEALVREHAVQSLGTI